MKVYMILKDLSSFSTVDKVFDSKDKAEKYFSTLNQKGFYIYRIVEKEVE